MKRRIALGFILGSMLVYGIVFNWPQPANAQPSPGIGLYPEDSAHASGHYGQFILAVRQALGTALCGTNGDYCALQVDANGALHVVAAPNTSTSANNDGACVSVTTASTAVLASFSTRKWASIVNQGAATVYIKFGATATSSDFPLPAGAAFNWPPGMSYTGAVDGISASGTNSVCVTEW